MIDNAYTYARSGNPRAKPLPWYALALLVFLFDAGSKAAIHSWMPYGHAIPFTNFFNLVHARNPGAAFSFLADAGGWQRYFFIVLACVISGWLALELRKALPSVQALGYSLILGGALGNAFDRGLRGYVVDYLDFHVGGWHWPAFNVADIGIVCGAGVMVFASLRASRELEKT